MSFITNLLERFKKILNNNKVLIIYKHSDGIYIIPEVLTICDSSQYYKNITKKIIHFLNITKYTINNTYLYNQFVRGINSIKISRFNNSIKVYPVAIPYDLNFIMYHKTPILESNINYTDIDIILKLLYANGYDYDDLNIINIDKDKDKDTINKIIVKKWK